MHFVSMRKVRNLHDFSEKLKGRNHLEFLGVGGDNIKVYCEIRHADEDWNRLSQSQCWATSHTI